MITAQHVERSPPRPQAGGGHFIRRPHAQTAPKQRRFVEEYLVDLNATQAAIRAGYSRKTAASIGEENLRKPEIQAAIKAAMTARQERTEITQDRVIAELAKIAFGDSRNVMSRGSSGVELKACTKPSDNGSVVSEALERRPKKLDRGLICG